MDLDRFKDIKCKSFIKAFQPAGAANMKPEPDQFTPEYHMRYNEFLHACKGQQICDDVTRTLWAYVKYYTRRHSLTLQRTAELVYAAYVQRDVRAVMILSHPEADELPNIPKGTVNQHTLLSGMCQEIAETSGLISSERFEKLNAKFRQACDMLNEVMMEVRDTYPDCSLQSYFDEIVIMSLRLPFYDETDEELQIMSAPVYNNWADK